MAKLPSSLMPLISQQWQPAAETRHQTRPPLGLIKWFGPCSAAPLGRPSTEHERSIKKPPELRMPNCHDQSYLGGRTILRERGAEVAASSLKTSHDVHTHWKRGGKSQAIAIKNVAT